MTTAEQNNDTKKKFFVQHVPNAELDSDTEYDEDKNLDKNIGCDFCHRCGTI